jgi:fructose-1,6-bisphosphatase/inositol monophosphatase family enzyme
LTTDIGSFTNERDRDAVEVFRRLEAAARFTRLWGDGYGYMMVATGRAEVMIDPALSLWDRAALQPVIEEAGGKFTDWQGGTTPTAPDGIATNGLLHDEVLAITHGF